MIPSIKIDDEPVGLLDVTFESERSCYILTKSMGKVKVGRHSSCDIQINHASVSREHFTIDIVSSDLLGETGETYQFELEDLKSFNKTMLNDESVDKRFLKNGDIVDAGMVRFRFHSLVL